jgi:hypothetical protein
VVRQKDTIISILYFVVASILVFGEAIRNQQLVTVFKPILIPLLAALYFLSSTKRSGIYFLALLMAVASNVMLIFSTNPLIFYGVTAFLVYRALVIIVVVNYTAKFHPLAFVIAIIPFLFIFIYLLDMTQATLSTGLYPAMANALVMSVLAALSLSNYVFEDDRRNSWLLISSLLFVVLMFIFVIERFYLENPVFRPLSVIIFSTAHFAFYRYLILSETEPADEPDEVGSV